MKTITVLPNNEIKYVKSIIFMVELFGRLYTGKIVYKREPSDNYKMDESKRSSIDKNHILTTLPSEKQMSVFSKKINWNDVDAKINEKRKASLSFLKELF